MIEGMVGKYGTLVNQRKTSKTSLIYLFLSTCDLWNTKSVQSSTKERNALGESQAISLNAKTSNMLHKKQENILETQSIRKTAPTNHASLDRLKQKYSKAACWTWQTRNIAYEQIKGKREDIFYQFVFCQHAFCDVQRVYIGTPKSVMLYIQHLLSKGRRSVML